MNKKLRLYLKVLLNGDFKPLFLKKKSPNKEQYLQCLKHCVIKSMMKVFYPYNVDIGFNDTLAFNSLTISASRGIIIYVECDLNLPPEEIEKNINPKEIEKNIRVFNLHPEFIKYVKIINHKIINNYL